MKTVHNSEDGTTAKVKCKAEQKITQGTNSKIVTLKRPNMFKSFPGYESPNSNNYLFAVVLKIEKTSFYNTYIVVTAQPLFQNILCTRATARDMILVH